MKNEIKYQVKELGREKGTDIDKERNRVNEKGTIETHREKVNAWPITNFGSKIGLRIAYVTD